MHQKRNVILGLQKVDWSDTARQNEFVSSVVSALNGVGENVDYDYVCAVSGSAFRTSFSADGWNHGNYHVINTPITIEHTFRMLGYKVSRRIQGDYETDSTLIMESIDRGFPVITLEGVVSHADACVISGYDDYGRVLLGYNPFMYIKDEQPEAPDDTGYFRKTDWHYGGEILIIEDKGEKLDKTAVFAETLSLVARLVREESLVPGQHNGIAAHKAFAEALLTHKWDDNSWVYLNVMCNYKQYLDRQYAVKFFRDNDRGDLADIYEKIASLCAKLGQIIPQDFSAEDMFGDKDKLRPYCDVLLQICDLEEQTVQLIAQEDMSKDAESRKPRILDYGPVRLIGVSRICKSSADCHNVWTDENGFKARLGDLETQAGQIPYYALCRCASGAEHGAFEYIVAMPVADDTLAPEGTIECVIPAGTYAEFSVAGMSDIGQVWGYTGEWLAAHPEWQGYCDGYSEKCGCVEHPSFEFYPPGFDGGGLFIYIPLRSS